MPYSPAGSRWFCAQETPPRLPFRHTWSIVVRPRRIAGTPFFLASLRGRLDLSCCVEIYRSHQFRNVIILPCPFGFARLFLCMVIVPRDRPSAASWTGPLLSLPSVFSLIRQPTPNVSCSFPSPSSVCRSNLSTLLLAPRCASCSFADASRRSTSFDGEYTVFSDEAEFQSSLEAFLASPDGLRYISSVIVADDGTIRATAILSEYSGEINGDAAKQVIGDAPALLSHSGRSNRCTHPHPSCGTPHECSMAVGEGDQSLKLPCRFSAC